MGRILFFLLILLQSFQAYSQENKNPVRIGIAGLSHSHVHWILGRENIGDIEIVGIVEPNKDLAERYSKQYKYSMDIVFDSLEEMIKSKNPQAVTAFGSIYSHLEVVEICAPKGVHVMVEKPLAVNLEHAKKMAALAKKHKIHLLTNYETTWYPSNHKAYKMVHNNEIGAIRKIIVRDGHYGPKEIGVNQEFLDWLTDPELNGGGALTDFGCYGANLVTWLHKGEKPISVTAITQTNKPDVYPNVDDEATIILKYPASQAIIQASWNWPISRKDMDIYGVHGAIYADSSTDFRYQLSEKHKEVSETLENREYPFNDPFAMLAAVIKNQWKPASYDLSTLENNLIVVEILDAAKQSAKTGTTIYLINENQNSDEKN